MYAQAAIKPNTSLCNGAYGFVMRGVQKCTRGCSSLRGRKRLPLCCIKLDTATDVLQKNLHSLSHSIYIDLVLSLPIGFDQIEQKDTRQYSFHQM